MGFSQEDILKEIPTRLHQFISSQDYESQYTSEDQAVWRYVMRQLSNHLKTVAHPVYLEGLKKTGISIEKIPSVEEMNRCLSQLGWKAVVVDGFIPPAAFMEFQKYKILPIALEMRSIKHILYTPAPDIVHESAGHAPIVVDHEYAEYLQKFGEIGTKAMYTKADYDVYEAIRYLSIIKEYSDTTEEDVLSAEKNLEEKSNVSTEPSEATLLSRLHWWTVEYGLVGTPEDYSIYGAGLLSSLGESQSCLNDEKVKKMRLTVDAVNTPYDITKAQPQLFVTKSCKHLMQVLNEYADQMCFRKGGAESIQTAIDAEIVSTLEYSSGIQVSGVANRLLKNAVGKEIYIGTSGPTQLSFADKQLEGHGTEYHSMGFGSPVGKLSNFIKPLEDARTSDLEILGLRLNTEARLEFISGVTVTGVLTQILYKNGKLILLSFEKCCVQAATGETLFEPEWGTYDMSVGERIVSVFAGSADKEMFNVYPDKSATKAIHNVHTTKQLELFKLYSQIRDSRESVHLDELLLMDIYQHLNDQFPNEWLPLVELLELTRSENLRDKIETDLTRISNHNDDIIKELIEKGRALVLPESLVGE